MSFASNIWMSSSNSAGDEIALMKKRKNLTSDLVRPPQVRRGGRAAFLDTKLGNVTLNRAMSSAMLVWHKT
jgi:hypothetical protein